MRALLDVNVLIALLDADHISHKTASGWFAKNARHGWASCPLTQNGCIRIMSSAAYPNALPIQALFARLTAACKEDIHEFWPDTPSLLDVRLFDATRIHGPRQLTDTYLLGLASKHQACLVTFDSKIPLSAVRIAKQSNLVVL